MFSSGRLFTKSPLISLFGLKIYNLRSEKHVRNYMKKGKSKRILPLKEKHNILIRYTKVITEIQ